MKTDFTCTTPITSSRSPSHSGNLECPARVMISYDDCPQARELYAHPKWRFVELQWKYSGTYAVSKQDKAANRKERKVDGQELLILNY